MASSTARLRHNGHKQMVKWNARTKAYSRAWGLHKRKKKLEERACSLPCNIQNNSSHCHRSLPSGVIVWPEDSHKDAWVARNYGKWWWATRLWVGKEDKSEDICRWTKGCSTKWPSDRRPSVPKEEKVGQLVSQIWKWALRNRWEEGQWRLDTVSYRGRNGTGIPQIAMVNGNHPERKLTLY